jgi:hypothetical protein
MNDYLYVIIAFVVVIAGAIFIPKLKKSGTITPDTLDTAEHALELVELILQRVNPKLAFQDKTKFIFDLASDIVDYVVALPSDEKADKIEFSLGVMHDILAKMKVPVTEDEKNLIDYAVREAFYSLDK